SRPPPWLRRPASPTGPPPASPPAGECCSGQPETWGFGLTRIRHRRTRGKLHADRGSGAGRAGERDRSAERLDAILEPDQAGAARRIGTADAVIRDLDPERFLAPETADRDRRGLRVLDGVRDRLGHDVVDRGF